MHRIVVDCARDASAKGWKHYQKHSIYRYRAELELLLGAKA
jgi:hypothetical protein